MKTLSPPEENIDGPAAAILKPFKGLPNELLNQILAFVASSDITEFFLLRSVCHLFNNLVIENARLLMPITVDIVDCECDLPGDGVKLRDDPLHRHLPKIVGDGHRLVPAQSSKTRHRFFRFAAALKCSPWSCCRLSSEDRSSHLERYLSSEASWRKITVDLCSLQQTSIQQIQVAILDGVSVYLKPLCQTRMSIGDVEFQHGGVPKNLTLGFYMGLLAALGKDANVGHFHIISNQRLRKTSAGIKPQNDHQIPPDTATDLRSEKKDGCVVLVIPKYIAAEAWCPKIIPWHPADRHSDQGGESGFPIIKWWNQSFTYGVGGGTWPAKAVDVSFANTGLRPFNSDRFLHLMNE